MELDVFEEPGEEWDEFASRYTDLIFYRSLWSRVLKRGLGGDPLYFYLRHEGRIVAGLPAVLFNLKVFRILYASIPYGNLIGEPCHFAAFISLLENEFRGRGIDQVTITDSPFSDDAYLPPGFTSINAKVSLLDLRGHTKEKLWGGYKKNIRRDIRKAQRSGMIIREAMSNRDVAGFHQLFLASLGRNRAPAKYPFRWFQALHEVLLENSSGTFLLAEVDHAAIAGVVLIYSRSSMHYYHNGSHCDFLKFCPNELLIHVGLERAIDMGNSWFDFMGSDPEDASLLRFKEKWGSRSLDLRTYVKDYHPVKARLWEWGKNVISSRVGGRLWKMIPR